MENTEAAKNEGKIKKKGKRSLYLHSIMSHFPNANVNVYPQDNHIACQHAKPGAKNRRTSVPPCQNYVQPPTELVFHGQRYVLSSGAFGSPPNPMTYPLPPRAMNFPFPQLPSNASDSTVRLIKVLLVWV